MSTETPALENTPTTVAEVVPEAAKAGLPDGNLVAVADKFWNETEEKKPEAKPEEKPAEKKSDTPAKGAEATPAPTLAEKFAARHKPAVSQDDAAPVKVLTQAKGPEEDMQLDAKASPKAREHFENLKNITRAERQRADAAERKAQEFDGRLKTVTTAPAPVDVAELERLRTEHKAMSDKLLLIDTRNHPVFQNQYVKPRQDALVQATELLKANGKEADLAALIEKPRGEIGKALAELLKDVNPFDQTEISNGVQTAYKLAQSEKQALAQAGQVSGAIRQQTAGQQAQSFDAVWTKVAAGVGEFLEPAEIPATATPEQRRGMEEYNNAMKSLQANARQIATGAASYDTIAEASIKAAAFDLNQKHVMPRIAAEFHAMQQVVAGLKKEVEGYRSRNPNRDIGATPAKGAEKTNGEHKTIEEAADTMLAGMGKGR